MKTSTRWAAAVMFLLLLTLAACASGIDLSKLPPIVITVPADKPAPPVDPTPTLPEPTPAPLAVEPAPEPVQLRDLELVVHEIVSGGFSSSVAKPIPQAWCVVTGEKRIADGSGFIHFPVPGDVDVECGALGKLTRTQRLAPSRQVFYLYPDYRPVPPAPVTPPAAVCPPGGDGLSCAQSIAAAHVELLTTNTFESCAEFLGHLLAALGPDFGYVGKTRGEGQHVPRGFIAGERVGDDGKRYFITGVSHDAIKRRDGQVFDVVVNAAANSDPRTEIHGPARVEWIVVPPHLWRAQNPFVPATAVPR